MTGLAMYRASVCNAYRITLNDWRFLFLRKIIDQVNYNESSTVNLHHRDSIMAGYQYSISEDRAFGSLLCSPSLSVSSLVSSQIMFGGFLETVSLCYITMVMLTVVPITPNAIILVMCSLPMISAIWEAIKSRSRWRTLNGKLEVIKFGASATFAVIGIALLLLKVRKSKSAQ